MDCLIFHDLFETFLSENDFCTITPYSKMFCKFSLELNMAKHGHVFITLRVRKPFFRGREKFGVLKWHEVHKFSRASEVQNFALKYRDIYKCVLSDRLKKLCFT